MSRTRETPQKRRKLIEEKTEDVEETQSQMDIYDEELVESEECDDTQMDLFTQARTQVEGVFLDEVEDEEEVEENAVHVTQTGSPVERVRFNPKPSKKDVVEVRQGYAELLTNLQQKKSQLMGCDGTETLASMVLKANNLLGKVHTTSDSTLDARFMSAAAQMGAEKVQKLPFGMTEFGLDDFTALVKTVLRRLDNRDISASQQAAHVAADDPWTVMGSKAAIHWRGVSSTDFLCGPIAVAPKEKAARKSTGRRKEKEPVKEVEALSKEEFDTKAQETSTSATTNNVMRVAAHLYELGAMPFHQFISDPDSFARSVENLFYCSFLVAEGRASIHIDEEDQIVISPVFQDEDEDEDKDNPVKPKHQNVFNFSMKDWKKAVLKYNITSPLIEL